MSDPYIWVKTIHLIAVIFWMAGMLYLPRLFVYHSSATLDGDLDRALKLQEARLLKIIMNPAMVVAFILGAVLIGFRSGELFSTIWLPVKLLCVFALMGYHGMLSADRKKFERGERPRSEKFYRIANEVPALLTIVIVIMAMVEPF